MVSVYRWYYVNIETIWELKGEHGDFKVGYKNNRLYVIQGNPTIEELKSLEQHISSFMGRVDRHPVGL